MSKFFVLLKKEIRELITLQTILPIILIAFIFMFMGKVVSGAQESIKSSQSVGLIDRDHSAASESITGTLEKAGFAVRSYSDDVDAAVSATQTAGGTAVLVVPQGFQESLQALSPEPIETYTIMRNFSATGIAGAEIVKAALSALNESFSDQLLAATGSANPSALKNPLSTVDYVQIGSRRAQADPAALVGFVSQQVTFIPIILFFIIFYASQIIATTIATEKENKTLETLLSLPISRRSIILAKMLAAGIVAALSSAVYMLGYQHYLTGLTGGTSDSSVHAVASQLGLVLTPANYLVLGVSLFCAILVALAIALILGAFSEDVKSVQSLIMPLLILIMIPYILTLVIDVQAASAPIRWLVYAIPFSHAFLTAPNLFQHNYAAIAWGIVYEIAVFGAFIAIATKIFSTDLIVTLKLNFSRKRRA